MRLVAPEQLIDTGLGAGPGIHAFDDDRTVKAVFSIGRGQIARHYHRAGGHAPMKYLAGFAVEYLGALSYEYTHRYHRILLHDHAFDDLGARADEAIVLDGAAASR